jgi:coenzyme F420 hydrogenase subunit beta
MIRKQDITQVVDNNLCHSCGACFSSCGHNSISFNENFTGHVLPKINYDTCTNCGLCFDVCSGDHFGESLVTNLPDDPFTGIILKTEVGYACNNRIYKEGQSGGVVTAILEYLFQTKQIGSAIVATMSDNIALRGRFKVVRSIDDLKGTQKSKYIPIPLLHAIPEIKNEILPIAIVGLSCHLHSLHNLIDKYRWLRKKEFIKIGLICDRVMLASSIDFITSQVTHEPIKNFVFRDTTTTSYPGDITFSTFNKKFYTINKNLRMIMKDFFTPSRCRLCFDKMNIFSDITIGDPHGVDDVDRLKGESLIMSRTDIGHKIIERSKLKGNISLRSVDTGLALKGQRIEKKRIDWNNYTFHWKELGNKVPNIPLNFSRTSNSNEFELQLNHSLHLLTLNNRENVLNYAKKYYKKYRFRKFKKLPNRAISKLHNKLKGLLK